MPHLTTLIAVLGRATLHLRILGLILMFGAALFGSLLFWLEKGTWQYWELTAITVGDDNL
jgi:hypothetical protein